MNLLVGIDIRIYTRRRLWLGFSPRYDIIIDLKSFDALYHKILRKAASSHAAEIEFFIHYYNKADSFLVTRKAHPSEIRRYFQDKESICRSK